MQKMMERVECENYIMINYTILIKHINHTMKILTF